jgi:hypothetical protein
MGDQMKWLWIGWIIAGLILECIGLFVIKGGTFSELIWHTENYVKGQRFTQWSFMHLFIFGAFEWMALHFAFRMWT